MFLFVFEDNLDQLYDMDPLTEPLDEIGMSNSLLDEFTNASPFSLLMSSQPRRSSAGRNSMDFLFWND